MEFSVGMAELLNIPTVSGRLPSRYGQRGQLVIVHSRTSLQLPHMHSRQYARIALIGVSLFDVSFFIVNSSFHLVLTLVLCALPSHEEHCIFPDISGLEQPGRSYKKWPCHFLLTRIPQIKNSRYGV